MTTRGDDGYPTPMETARDILNELYQTLRREHVLKLLVLDVDGVRVGINICYDGRHPGSSLAAAHLGAEVILHPHGNHAGGLGLNPRDWTNKKRSYLGPRAVDTSTYA